MGGGIKIVIHHFLVSRDRLLNGMILKSNYIFKNSSSRKMKSRKWSIRNHHEKFLHSGKLEK